MNSIHTLLVYAHVAVGALALVLFWIPVIAKKGSSLHVKSGRVYTIAMYIVSVTAFIASIMVIADPLGIRRPGEVFDATRAAELSSVYRMFSLFLLMLSVLVFVSIRHGLAALGARRDAAILRRREHRMMLVTLAVLAITVGAIGLANGQLLLIIFAGIGVSAAATMFRDTMIAGPRPAQLVFAHLNGLIGSGIGAYTAFFAFGGARFLGDLLPGQWQVVPWVLPAVIGTIVINRLSRRYPAARAQRRPGRATAALR